MSRLFNMSGWKNDMELRRDAWTRQTQSPDGKVHSRELPSTQNLNQGISSIEHVYGCSI